MRFPYGLADFAKIQEGGYFYVDRTDRIRLIEQAGDQLLFLRPRRFGKSLWLSTLENYYDLDKAGDFERLFGKLKIGQNPTPLHNRYFILKLNFSVVDPSGDRDAIRRALFDHLNVRITDVIGRYTEWLGDRVCVLPDNGIASFQSLISVVSQTPYKLYLLIDEYDNFANEVMISRERGKNRYQELVEGEGIIKTFFKAIKDGAEGRGVDRVFITGVSPVVLSDMTSGYNVVKILSHRPEYDDLLGFTADEIQATLEKIAASGMMPTIPVPEALHLMRTFYNGYCFSPRSAVQVYNPTLALYFLEALAQDGEYPAKMLDDNLAMDRNRIQYVAQLPHGSTLITQALAADADDPESAILIDQLADRFGVEMMLNTPKDQTFLASLLYYFGILTLAGRNELGQLRLTIPNLVVRKLYVERLQEALLPDYEDQEQRQAAARCFYAHGELGPLCELLEQRYFKVFDNRDLRWSNELVVKTAFLVTLFNDTFYIMDSEPALDKGYGDLSLILRPDIRQYRLLDHLLEFKYIPLKTLGLSNEAVGAMDRETLRALPAVAEQLQDAETQLVRYRTILERVYGEKLKLHTHAVVCIGLERLVWFSSGDHSAQGKKAH